ncbi:MAG: hypothetical protein JHC85_15320, partial [Chthoniobacterales bacterium]|nr:hypothetical protein [Chthoniobacterales bacterium]
MNKTILLLIACLTGHTLAAESTSAKQQLRFHVAAEKTPLVNRTEEILQRRIQEQCGIVPEESAADATLILAKEPGIGEEGFRISEDPDGKIHITGNDDRGLLYGVGKFLHTSRYEEGRFTPSAWRCVRKSPTGAADSVLPRSGTLPASELKARRARRNMNHGLYQ